MKYLLLLLALFVLPRFVAASVVAPSPVDQNVIVGKTFTVDVSVDSEGREINVVEARLTYPIALLKAVNVAKTPGFLSLWPEEPAIDAAAGAMSFVGGIPGGTVVFHAPAVTVTFLALREGTARIGIDGANTSVLLNDGSGTASVVATREATVQITHQDALMPELFSPTHPYEDVWYASRDVVVTWESPASILSSVLLSRDPDAAPDDIQEEGSGTISYPSLTDGVWYVSLKQKFPGPEAWGPVARRRIRIDGTAPTTPSVLLLEEQGTLFTTFTAEDDESGVDHYELRVRKSRFSWFPFFANGGWVTAASPVRLPRNASVASIEVHAVDEAGNVSAARLSVHAHRSRQWKFFFGCLVALITFVALRLVTIERKRRKRS